MLDYNNFYSTASKFVSIGYSPKTYYTSLSAWQKYSSVDSHSIAINPQFISSTDLHVKNDSLNAGIYLASLPNDIDGQVRRITNPTIGADEIPKKTKCGFSIYFRSQNTVSNCAPQIVDFDSIAPTKNIAKYTWNYGDKVTYTTTSSSSTHIYTLNNSGGYNVTLSVTDSNGCTDSFTRNNYIHIIGAEPSFTLNDHVFCGDANVTFTNTSKNCALLTIDFKDGSAKDTSNKSSFTHKYVYNDFSKPFIYFYPSMLGIHPLHKCLETFTDSIILYRPVKVKFGITSTTKTCNSYTVNFIDSSKYSDTTLNRWDLDGDGKIDVNGTRHASFTYTRNGTFYPKLTIGSAHCVDSMMIPIYSNAISLSGTYTIGGAGADYATFSDAANDLDSSGVCGPVLFNVADGIYNEQITLTHIKGASAANTITFQSASGDSSKVILNYPYAATNNCIIRLIGADWITFNKISIRDNYSNNSVNILLKGASHNIVKNCFLYKPQNSSSSGFLIASADSTNFGNSQYNTFYNNLLRGGYGGLSMSVDYGTNAKDNNITSNTIDSFIGTAINMNLQDSFSISNNKISGVLGGIFITNQPHVPTRDSIFIVNNFISIYGYNKMNMLGAINSSDATRLSIYNNNIYFHYPYTGFTTSGVIDLNSSTSSDSVFIKNNIIVDMSSINPPIKATIAPIYSDYNSVYGNTYTLADWISVTGMDNHSISANPQYTSSSDLHVKNDSLNAGIYVSSYPTDIDGQNRHWGNPTIGADEIPHKTTSCMSGPYTIGATGADYATFNDAVSDLKTYGVCGPVVFNAADGTYQEQVKIDSIVGTSTTNTVTFQSASKDSTKVILTWPSEISVSSSTQPHDYTVRFNGCDNVILQKMTLQRPSAPGYPISKVIDMKYFSNNNKILNNRILSGKDGQSALINCNGDTGIIISNNYFKYGGFAIWMKDTVLNTPVSTNNIIDNNTMDSQSYSQIELKDISSTSILSNSFKSRSIAISLSYSSARTTGNILIDKNIINNSGGGIMAAMGTYGTPKSSVSISIQNNFITMLDSSSIALNYYSSRYLILPKFEVLNNTFNCSTNYAVLGISDSLSPIYVLNNIFSNTKKGKAIDAGRGVSLQMVCDNNDYYVKAAKPFSFIVNSFYVDYDFASWKTTTGLDSNSIQVDPRFNSSTDLHVNNGSLMAGKPLSNVTTDIDGQIRSTTHPTIGADEIQFSSSKPVAHYSSKSKACRGDSILFKDSSSYSGGDSITSRTWSFGDGNTSSLKNPVHQYMHGGTFTTTLIVTSVSGGKDTASTSISIDSTCVWPGDINYDKVVDVRDILPMGVEYGATGYARKNASTNWFGQPSKDWGDTLYTGVDYKHGDCNGDSIINGADTLAILKNYSLTHKKTHGMYKGSATDPTLFISFSKDSFQVGDTAYADILFGTSAIPAKDVYGFAFSLNLNPELIDTNSITMTFANTWFASDNNYIKITKQFKNDGRIDIGVTRIDKIPRTGYGKIATMAIVIVDNIAGKRFVKKSLPLMFDNIEIVNEHLNDLPFNVNNDSTFVYQFKTGIDENEMGNADIHVYPNPARDNINIETKDINMKSVKILDILGKQLSAVQLHEQNTCTIPTENLSNGIYILEIQTMTSSYKVKLKVSK